MHFRIDGKRIGRLRRVKVLQEEFGQEMRLVHLVNAGAEPKKFARQIVEPTLAPRFPMSRQFHSVLHCIRGRGDQICRSCRRGAVRELRSNGPAKNVPRFETGFRRQEFLLFGAGHQGQSLFG